MDMLQGMLLEEVRKLSVHTAERRRRSRTRIARPVYIRRADPSETDFEEVQTTTDFSDVGLHFVTAQRDFCRKGMQLYMIPLLGCLNFEYLGEVVRMERRLDGRYGIAVELLRIDRPIVDHRAVGKSAFRDPNVLRLAETWMEFSPMPASVKEHQR